MLNDYLVDYEKCTVINNIEYSSIENVNPFLKKIKFYNPDVTEPLHKFWFYIKNAKLIKKSSMTLHIALSNKETKLIECMNSLDEKISEILHKKNEKYNIRPSLTLSPNYPPVITLGVESTSKCYDTDNNLIDYLGIRNGATVHTFIEFESVTIGSGECTKKWKVLQIKENKTLDMSLNFFEIQPRPQIEPRMFLPPVSHAGMPMQLGGTIPLPPPPPMQLVPTMHLDPPSKPTAANLPVSASKNSTSSGFCPPSLNDLLGSISKLKKAKTNDKIDTITIKNDKQNTITIKNDKQNTLTVKDDKQYIVTVKDDKQDIIIVKDDKQDIKQYIAKIKREHDEDMINHNKSVKIAKGYIDFITACIEKKKKKRETYIEFTDNNDDSYDPFFMT